MSDDFAERMSKNDRARYIVENHPGHGFITIRRLDEKPMSHKEYVWVRNLISVSLRAERIGEVKQNAQPAKRIKDSDVDPIIKLLGAQHMERRISFKQISLLIGTHTSSMSDIFKGRRRPMLEIIRAWAYALGFDIMAVPVPLRSAVQAMCSAYLEENHLDTSYYKEDVKLQQQAGRNEDGEG